MTQLIMGQEFGCVDLIKIIKPCSDTWEKNLGCINSSLDTRFLLCSLNTVVRSQNTCRKLIYMNVKKKSNSSKGYIM